MKKVYLENCVNEVVFVQFNGTLYPIPPTENLEVTEKEANQIKEEFKVFFEKGMLQVKVEEGKEKALSQSKIEKILSYPYLKFEKELKKIEDLEFLSKLFEQATGKKKERIKEKIDFLTVPQAIEITKR